MGQEREYYHESSLYLVGLGRSRKTKLLEFMYDVPNVPTKSQMSSRE